MMARQGATILIVDDDVDICRNLADILTDLDYRVEYAHDGVTALALVRQKPYDVALIDLKMPGMDGLSLYREIKKLRAGTVALIVSAYSSVATADAALDAGAWQVLSKPVDLPHLLSLVNQALDQPLVLVVDDDQALCANLWDLLRERNFRVCLAHDEREAAERLRDTSFKAVLIDMKIPGGGGGRIFELVRRANPQARTVLITGNRAETDRQIEQILVAGADAVCYKPFDIPRLISTLNRLTSLPE
jgi:two-component system, NtrC family, response regulator HydG